MNKCFFVSFASTNMEDSLRRIGKEAKKFNLFDEIMLYTEKNLPEYGKKRCEEIINSTGTKRGYGYWNWKPVVILEAMKKASEGDLILYCDAGNHLNVKGKNKLLEYFEITKKNDIWVTLLEPCHYDYKWTKMDTINLFPEIDKKLLLQGQLEGCNICLVKNAYTLKIINQYCEMMDYKNIHYFDDSPSIAGNYSEFKENRHDQSILSLILKSNHYASTTVDHFWAKDDEGWKNLWESEPILQSRDVNRSISKEKKGYKNIIKNIIKKFK